MMGQIAEAVYARCEPNEETGCLEWTGAKNLQGYGKICRQRRFFGTHRVAFEAANGPIPADMVVMHRCDNPACCNPAHLMLGTPRMNSDDMVAKGRSNTGGKHWASRLSAADVAEIVARVAKGETQRAVAKAFGVSFQHVNDIVHGKKWPSGRA